MAAKNMMDETTRYIETLKASLPSTRKDYVVNGVIHAAALAEDMKAINQSVEVFNILRDCLDDMAKRIGMASDGYAKAKKKMAEELAGIGKFTPRATKKDEVTMSGVPRVDYVVDNQVVTRTPLRCGDGTCTMSGCNATMADNPSGRQDNPLGRQGTPRSDDKTPTAPAALNAIHVDHKNQVRSDGNLYYIRPLNRFALRVNGHLLTGNVGEVYTHGGTPQKIKPCSNGKNCKDATCTYYHPDNGDVRNFISGSFSYQRKTDGISRKIGNRSTLAADIAKATRAEIELYQDQSIHDLLCHLAILDTQR